jgi:branched-subunit amino acid transport protein AzlD
MIDITTAVAYTFAAGAAVFFCRAFPFLIIKRRKNNENNDANDNDDDSDAVHAKRADHFDVFLSLIERAVPPAAMTVLAVNSIAAPVKENPAAGIPVLAASAVTLAAQLWKRNYLLSILGGTAVFMVLTRLLGR